jgi:hypothetical protein
LGLVENMADNPIGDVVLIAELSSQGFDIVSHIPGGLNIFFDFIDRAQRKFTLLINRTEKTLIPRAVAGDPQQQATRLVGWPDGALFKIQFFFVHFMIWFTLLIHL